MTPTPVGMRCPECSRQRTRVVTMRNVRAVPRVTYALIAINVIAFLTEQGPFTISLRAYLAKAELLDGRWRAPPLVRLQG